MNQNRRGHRILVIKRQMKWILQARLSLHKAVRLASTASLSDERLQDEWLPSLQVCQKRLQLYLGRVPSTIATLYEPAVTKELTEAHQIFSDLTRSLLHISPAGCEGQTRTAEGSEQISKVETIVAKLVDNAMIDTINNHVANNEDLLIPAAHSTERKKRNSRNRRRRKRKQPINNDSQTLSLEPQLPLPEFADEPPKADALTNNFRSNAAESCKPKDMEVSEAEKEIQTTQDQTMTSVEDGYSSDSTLVPENILSQCRQAFLAKYEMFRIEHEKKEMAIITGMDGLDLWRWSEPYLSTIDIEQLP